jgi:hypothetical protein
MGRITDNEFDSEVRADRVLMTEVKMVFGGTEL